MKKKIPDFAGRGYSAKNKGDKEGELWIYEEIGDSWFGGVLATKIKDDIKAFGNVDVINVHINSPGGDVFDGVAVYNILKQNRARVVVHIDGLAASIASVIAMAGDEIYMADNALMMIHDAWTVAVGPAEELRAAADMLDKVNESILTTYMKRVTIDESEVRGLMKGETWMDAKEALGYGFVDELTDPLEMAACFDMSKFKYKNIPKDKIRKNPSTDFDVRQRLGHMACVTRKYAAVNGRA